MGSGKCDHSIDGGGGLWLWCVDVCVGGLRECWGLGVHCSVRVPGYRGYIMYVLQGKSVQGTRQMQKIYDMWYTPVNSKT